ncbi:MAG: hypothetical protein AAF333_17775 [Planctomycetota bacterium]
MALAKRSSRTISIDGLEYRWAVSPDSGYLCLVVERADRPGQRVEASFDYHDVVQPDGCIAGQRRSVSPGVVRAVVLHALANGWRSEAPGLKPFRVDGEAVRPVDESSDRG